MTSVNGPSRASSTAATAPTGAPGGVEPEAGPGYAPDRVSLSRRAAAAREGGFSWSRALGAFGRGFGLEARGLWEGMLHHPLQALAMTAGSIALVALLPVVLPVSAAAVGTALTAGFVLYGAAKMALGAIRAFQDHRRGDDRQAEQDFERIGRGGFDVAAVAVPAGLGRAASILVRTRAGQASLEVLEGSRAGQVAERAVATVESLPGRVVGEGRLAAAEAHLASAVDAVRGSAAVRAVRGNGAVRDASAAFDAVFDNPSVRALQAADDQRLIGAIDHSGIGKRIEAWAHTHGATSGSAAGVAVAGTTDTSKVPEKTGIEGSGNVTYQDIKTPADLDRLSPGFREKVIADLESRGIKGYTAKDIVIGRKRLFQADVVPESRYAELGIKQVTVDGQPKLAVPTIDSDKPLLYDPGTKIIQKLRTNPDSGELILANGKPQTLEMYGVPAKKFASLYQPTGAGRFIAADKRVVAIRATQPGTLKTPWEPMTVKPGDAIIYPIDQTPGGFSLGAPYRHEGGAVLRDAYTLPGQP